MYAFLPLPLVTTLSRARLTSLDASGLITCLTFFLVFSLITELVSGSFKLLTIYGLYKIPPLIAADTAVTCCIGVTDTPWPNAVVASSTGPTLSKLNIIPVASPFKSTPVFLPKPNFSI